MSGTELLVVVFGLFIGYWIVSQFASGKKTPADSADREAQRDTDNGHEPRQTGGKGGDPHRQQPRQQETEPSATWYEVLNVAPDASPEEIRLAYRNLVSQYHPDKVATLGPELRELCEGKTKEINTAYDRAMAERGHLG